jgi:hypothetical protein
LAVNERESVKALNADARKTLLSHIGSEIRPRVSALKTANEIWDALKDIFMKPSLRTLVRLSCEAEKQKAKIITTESLVERDDISEEIQFVRELYQSMNFTIDFADFQFVALEINKLRTKWPAAYEKVLSMNPKDISIPQMRNIVYEWITEKEANEKIEENLNKKKINIKSPENSKLKCQHCKKIGHLEETCYFKHGFPDHWKNNKKEINSYLEENDSEKIVIDSGATNHVTNNKMLLENTMNVKKCFNGVNATKIYSTLVGDINLKIGENVLSLKEVYFCPSVTGTFVSMGKLMEQNFKIEKEKENFILITQNQQKFDTIFKNNMLMLVTNKEKNLNHKRLGHMGDSKGKILEKDFNINMHNEKCISCDIVKTNMEKIKKRTNPLSNRAFQLIHSDVKGPIKPSGFGHESYIVTFIDDFSRYAFTYPISSKDRVVDAFRLFHSMITNKFQERIDVLFTDHGGEYIGKALTLYLNEHKIKHNFSTPNTPEENGICERFNRTITEKIKILLLESRLTHEFWPEACRTATYLYNRTPHAYLDNKTPYEIIYKKKPSLHNLRVFGCLVFEKNTDIKAKTLSPSNRIGIMVGYSEDHPNAWKIYYMDKKEILEQRKIVFKENYTINDLEKLIDTRKEAKNEKCFASIEEIETIAGLTNDDPKNVQRALKSNQSEEWKKAMKLELESFKEHEVYKEVKNSGQNLITTRWVFTTKMTGKKKARLVGRGFSQIPGIDFHETFSPTLKADTLKLILALTAQNGWKFCQMDVSTAFLNAPLEEEIYAKIPEGAPNANNPSLVWKIEKAMYGLKQAPRAWNNCMTEFLKEIGMERTKTDICVFKKCLNGIIILVLLYVDDLFIVSNSQNELENIKEKLNKRFKMNNMEEARNFIGFNITKNNETGEIAINQNDFAGNLLEKTQFSFTPISNTPLAPKMRLVQIETEMTKEEKEYMKDKPYGNIVGSLVYLATNTRPDLTFAVQQLARHMQNPRRVHWEALERTLSYLKRVPKHEIVYKPNCVNQILAYSDADYQGDNGSSYSTSGYTIMLAGGAIAWGSKKQDRIARSSTEAEFNALDYCARTVEELSSICKELEIEMPVPKVYEDNQSTISIVRNHDKHQRSRHFDFRRNIIRDLEEAKVIQLEYICTEDNLADPMTKSVSGPRLNKMSQAWGLRTLGGGVTIESISTTPL